MFTYKNSNEIILTYKWTGKNEYFMLSNSSLIAIGGGLNFFTFFLTIFSSRYGLQLEKNFTTGTSGTCETFDNDILSSTPEFTCKQLEVGIFVCDKYLFRFGG